MAQLIHESDEDFFYDFQFNLTIDGEVKKLSVSDVCRVKEFYRLDKSTKMKIIGLGFEPIPNYGDVYRNVETGLCPYVKIFGYKVLVFSGGEYRRGDFRLYYHGFVNL